MTENDKRNIAVARLLYTGDEAERASIAPDIVWHVPGHNPVSGDYHGFEAYTELMPARILRLNDSGQIVEGWGFTSDQDALDEFFSA